MGSAIDRRHVYVYGTAGSPANEEALARREMANRAATWGNTSAGSGRLLLGMRAVPDTQVRPSDLQSSDLFLFGTNETNTVIAKFAEELPLHLDPRAAGYGLVYVYPVNGHYFLVGSGTVVSAYGPGTAAPGRARSASGGRRTRWRGSGRRRIRPSGYFARHRLFRPGATLVDQVGRLHFVQGHTHQHPGSRPV